MYSRYLQGVLTTLYNYTWQIEVSCPRSPLRPTVEILYLLINRYPFVQYSVRQGREFHCIVHVSVADKQIPTLATLPILVPRRKANIPTFIEKGLQTVTRYKTRTRNCREHSFSWLSLTQL